MGTKKYILPAVLFCLNLVLGSGCLELYDPPTSSIDYNFLVVDGYLNGSDTTVVKLSRTQTLSSTSLPTVIVDASVQIEDDQGGVSPMASGYNGSYYLAPRSWNPALNYRIRISTNAKEYVSDFVPLTQTPAIDSISWKLEPSGIQILANTHDPTNTAKYYLWTFVETWEYSPPFYSYFVLKNGQAVPRTDDIYHCWISKTSTQIYIASSVKLSQDIISEFPLNLIPNQDARLQYKYSSLVTQQALSEDAYQYWSTLQKNTENLGTLFGPQPSQLTGNIHCTNNPSETVLGYFNATTVSEQRLFISHSQLPNVIHYFGYEGCEFSTLALDLVPLYTGEDLITSAVFQGLTLIGYTTGPPGCIDCRYHGGNNVKPAFWGN